MVEYIIRFAEYSDAESILNFTKKLGKESPYLLFDEEGISFSVREEEKYISDLQGTKSMLLVAENVEGQIIGTLGMHVSPKEKISHRGEFGIGVLKQYQKKGVGNALIEEMFAYAKNVDLKVIDLTVAKSNIEAIRLYERKGFLRTGEIHMMIKTSAGFEDGYSYQKIL